MAQESSSFEGVPLKWAVVSVMLFPPRTSFDTVLGLGPVQEATEVHLIQVSEPHSSEPEFKPNSWPRAKVSSDLGLPPANAMHRAERSMITGVTHEFNETCLSVTFYFMKKDSQTML